jgi:hypothetical protein
VAAPAASPATPPTTVTASPAAPTKPSSRTAAGGPTSQQHTTTTLGDVSPPLGTLPFTGLALLRVVLAALLALLLGASIRRTAHVR